MDLAVAELLSGGYVQTVSARPYICSPLSEEAYNINLCHMNQLVQKPKFKYEDLGIAMMLFRSGEYMI